MSFQARVYGSEDFRLNNAPTSLYDQSVIDGYKRLLKETADECTKLRQEIASLKRKNRPAAERPSKTTGRPIDTKSDIQIK